MIVITGDSHVNALRHGAVALAEELRQKVDRPIRIGALGNGKHTLRPFAEAGADGVRLTEPSYATALHRLTGEDAFRPDPGVTHGICLGFHSPPTFRHPMWQRHAPSSLRMGHGKIPVSSAVVEAIVLANNRHIYDFFKALVSAGVDFFVISSPPPRRDHYCLKEAPAEVILEVDRMFRATVRRDLDLLGVGHVMPPAGVFDEQGFLREDLAQKAPNDFHHGNAEYGKAMIRALFLDDSGSPPDPAASHLAQATPV